MSDVAATKASARLPFTSNSGYDLLARIPAVAFFGFSAWAYGRTALASLSSPGSLLSLENLGAAGTLQLLARVAGFLFVLSVAVAMATRLPPVARRGGVLPRLVALGGTLSLLGMPVVAMPIEMPLGMAALSFSLLAAGYAFSCYALLHLGRALSIMAEARRLVTTGPYRAVRHPLYAAEALASLGILLQYWSAPAVLLWVVHISLQAGRMHYEEQVLARAFPEYAGYARRTARILPGVF